MHTVIFKIQTYTVISRRVAVTVAAVLWLQQPQNNNSVDIVIATTIGVSDLSRRFVSVSCPVTVGSWGDVVHVLEIHRTD